LTIALHALKTITNVYPASILSFLNSMALGVKKDLRTAPKELVLTEMMARTGSVQNARLDSTLLTENATLAQQTPNSPYQTAKL